LSSPLGFIIFKVIDEKNPRILSYDEVKDKVRRVIMGTKVTKLSKEIQDKMLKDYHFRLLINSLIYPGDGRPRPLCTNILERHLAFPP
jgi:hypothetical protein